MANYVDTQELRRHWVNWLDNNSEEAWNYICDSVYKICHGVAIRFKPADENEHHELTHHAFLETITKIKNGKEGKIPKLIDNGNAPLFNLITTAVYNTLFTLMKKRERKIHHYNNYRQQQIYVNKHIIEAEK